MLSVDKVYSRAVTMSHGFFVAFISKALLLSSREDLQEMVKDDPLENLVGFEPLLDNTSEYIHLSSCPPCWVGRPSGGTLQQLRWRRAHSRLGSPL